MALPVHEIEQTLSFLGKNSSIVKYKQIRCVSTFEMKFPHETFPEIRTLFDSMRIGNCEVTQRTLPPPPPKFQSPFRAVFPVGMDLGAVIYPNDAWLGAHRHLIPYRDPAKRMRLPMDSSLMPFGVRFLPERASGSTSQARPSGIPGFVRRQL